MNRREFIGGAAATLAAGMLLVSVTAQALEAQPSAAPVKIVFDTDMLTDFDDVGALACLHALADAGECEILATVSSTRGNASVGAIEVINSYCGRGDLPVGAPKGMGVCGAYAGAKSKVDSKSPIGQKEGGDGGHYKYRKLCADYPQWVRHADADDAPDANEVYRRALAEAPDGSVVICTVGFLTNLRRLLETKGDDISPLDGKALVAKKVKRWVAMACNYPRGQEYNSRWDWESSKIAFENWPTPVVFSDWQYGGDLFAGRAVAEMKGPRNPVKDVFAGNIPSCEEIAKDPAGWMRGCFGMGGRAAWDETAVLAAVRGTDEYFNVHRGTYRMIGTGGDNEWVPDEADGRHLRLTEKVNKSEVARVIDDLICGAVQSATEGSAYEIAKAPLLTEWGEKMTPETAWREYPRPQMVRGNWTNLNGLWDYAITSNVEHRAVTVATGKILVPFAFESPLSGVGRLVAPHEKMVYTRRIDVHPKKGMRTLLNFEAVDWRASVYVNGVEAMDAPHEGGNLPFSVDITPFVREGSNELKVVAWDPTHTFINAGGKQNDKTKGCFYTRVSGIWQTVWMEEVPETYIRGYKVTTDIDDSTVKFDFDIAGGGDVTVKVDGVLQSGESSESGEVAVRIPNAELWSPENPKLYEFTATCGADKIRGYFAMRKIDKAKDAKGNWRFRLNNRFVFPMGTLDQGWWPDGLLTPPSLAACEHDIRTLKACGFNMMRKHIKVEPRLYYHLCDRLGLMVFQDAPSPAGDCNIFDEAKSLQRYGMFRREWKEEMDHLFNVPSIVMWIPYNEFWGQPDAEYTDDTLRWTKRHDPTRLVGGPSGWSDFEGGDGVVKGKVVRDASAESDNPAADTVDQHNYPGPGQCKNRKNRISLLGEFGGLGLKIPGHLWNEKGAWGYAGTGEVVSREANQKHYLELMDKLVPLVEDGLAGTVYTQTTDVELEINGLMTYDRKVLKYDPEVLKAAHRKINEGIETAK